MLWLCLYFPLLPLELFSRAGEADSPWAVSQGKGTRQTLWLCNEVAAALGVRPGMTPGGAYGLAPTLQLRRRDAAAEQQALTGLAAWAGQFTSQVSLLPPQALLLEIAGSLQLFGGVEALLARIRRRAQQLGYCSELGVAPTPLSAWLLARSGRDQVVLERQDLPAALRHLPLDLLDLDDRLNTTLRRLGLRRLGELLRLPRADLSRRLGGELIHYLDRLLGRCADPRPAYRPPPRFQQTLVLPAETGNTQALLFPARRLLLELSGFLTAHQAGTLQLRWTLLAHHHQPPTHLKLGLAAPSRDAEHLLRLLSERLERTPLPHAVEALTLQVEELQALPGHNLHLDGDHGPGAADWPQLVERLRARLGEAAVQGLACRADHRPEQAWGPAAPGSQVSALPHPNRPLWLLPDPVPLDVRDARPCLDGRSLQLQGPERLESGWWDGGDISRDYFIARDADHGRYWIYRERRTRRWFLHGLFA